jgi:ISXO2-like transposase domain
LTNPQETDITTVIQRRRQHPRLTGRDPSEWVVAIVGMRSQISTNTVEGFYSVFKRGMKGVYQHCSEKHLHRYLSEFDFRHSNRVALGIGDTERAENALKGIVGKRLKYNPPANQ